MTRLDLKMHQSTFQFKQLHQAEKCLYRANFVLVSALFSVRCMDTVSHLLHYLEGDYSEIKCNCCPNCKCLDAKFGEFNFSVISVWGTDFLFL